MMKSTGIVISPLHCHMIREYHNTLYITGVSMIETSKIAEVINCVVATWSKLLAILALSFCLS